MDKLTKLRGSYRGSFTKFITKVDEFVKSETVDPDSCSSFIAQLQEKYDKIRKVNDDILNILQEDENCTQNMIDEEIEGVDSYEEKYIDLKTKLERRLNKSGSSNETFTENENNGIKRNFKLPKIELQKFDGNLKDWLSFWELFKKIDKDPDLSDEEKFQYLIQSTVKGSRAREVVESFPPTAKNYKQAVECLQSRFGKEDVLVEVYVRELLSLVLNNALDKERKMPLVKLYDRLETQLRSLKILGVTSDKYSSMLYPLIESCLSINLLRVWERHSSLTSDEKDFNKLDALMKFLRNEIDGEEKINLAKSGFGFETKTKPTLRFPQTRNKVVPTGMELFNDVDNKRVVKDSQCVFCEKSHSSADCRHAKSLSLDQRKEILVKKGCCFRCLRRNHIANSCRAKSNCSNCGRQHHAMLCKIDQLSKTRPDEDAVQQDETLANISSSPNVLLQTLSVLLRGKAGTVKIRAIIDSASQRSYILKDTAKKVNYEPIRKENLRHSLFGGTCTDICEHDVYKAYISDLNGTYSCNFDVLSQPLICKTKPEIAPKLSRKELADYDIHLTDSDEGAIELLIGADIAGKLMTGGYKRLPSGLAAIETKLGWTVMGRSFTKSSDTTDLIVTSMLINDVPLTNLWDLDIIGIRDSAEKKSKKEQEEAANEHFLKTLRILPDGRYEVSLPWLEGHQTLENNRFSAEKRLRSTVRNLQTTGLLKNYEDVFSEWLSEGIIEEIDICKLEDSNCLYLPHRAVIKEHSTTKIRPVFDASARQRNRPSLNDCLEKGPNLVDLIPSILNRFRWKKYGVIADIRKAFLQISVNKRDRDYLRFLWYKDSDPEKLKIFRHKRVVFGVNASPFLLGATIAHHLDSVPAHQRETAKKLKRSMYVDNCVTSLESKEELDHFIEQSKQIMLTAQFELRDWRHNKMRSPDPSTNERNLQEEKLDETVSVLGLQWNTMEDTLCCTPKNAIITLKLPITKRAILSTTNQIFDPLGLLSPITLPLKILIQDCWKAKLSWDVELPEEISKKYLKWKRNLEKIKELKFPRRLTSNDNEAQSSYHVFCDASLKAYATCIYVRNEDMHGVSCQLVQARSRVAPLKSVTISRLELLACTIGVRLMNSIKEDLKLGQVVPIFYWTDSMNALHWIKNEERWGVFVMNRVLEIREYSKPTEWNHISGILNPADLPSRGCSIEIMISQEWHNGPSWLKEDRRYWPSTEIVPDRNVVNSEKRKTIISSLTVRTEELPYLMQISNFEKIVRVTAWIRRFISNCKVPETSRNLQTLKVNELKEAELTVWKMVQSNSFKSIDDTRLRHLCPFTDPTGIIRTKTRLLMREDFEDFKCPIILPSDHAVVMNLIMHKHKTSSHCGIQTMMSILREDFWILKTRRTIRKVLRGCITCKRYNAKHPEVYAAPLPEDRLRDSSVFEVTGIDLAGPLLLRDGTKAWIVLFSCAVYRSIHLELVSSLSTDKFLMSLRRFISRRGRPSVIYTDNGSNFTGSNLALKSIEWDKVVKDSSIRRITWKFIPPGSPWWGGFWERMVGLTKNVLRKVLGKASLKYEELLTVLCDCENIINSRPLTYISEDLELEPLTPAMFLRDIKESGIPDLDHIDAKRLQKRIVYRMKICEDLRKRFRSEYLGQLRNCTTKLKNYHIFSIGDIVLLKSSDKRINWPLAKITKTYPGKDGIIRLVQLQTSSSTFLRPVQSIYPLELTSPMDEKLRQTVTKDSSTTDVGRMSNDSPKRSLYGRQIRAPQRLDL